MLTVAREVVIGRPIEQVFSFVADFAHEPRYNPALASMRKITPGAIGVGTSWQEEVRLVGIHRTHRRTVTVYEPKHTLAYQNDGRPFPVEVAFRFASVPNGNRVTAAVKLQLGGVYTAAALLFYLLLPTLVGRIIRNIKHALEAQQLAS